MAHAEKPEPLSRRDALMLQRRIATFLLAFSVALIAIMITLAAVQNRDATCQDRAHQVVYDNTLLPDLSKSDIVGVIGEVLASRKAVLDPDAFSAASGRSKTVEVLDTASNVIAANGFRLLHRTDGTNHRYEMRAIFDRLCDAKPTISMEVLPNVDYEKAIYQTKAISMMNGTQRYMLESSLNTKDANRITTFAQLQSLFPGFNSLTVASKLAPRAGYSYTASGGGGQVYYNGRPLDIAILLQQWSDGSGKALFWRVALSTESVFAENDLTSLEVSLRSAFDFYNYTCSRDRCKAFDAYLR